MPIRLIDSKSPIQWVHPLERDADGAPVPGAMVWHIVTLTEGESRKISNLYLGTTPNIQVANHIQREVFMRCVAKIDNVLLPGESSRRTISGPEDKEQFYNSFPAECMGAVYAAIQSVNELERGTLKNSAASSVSQPS